MQTLPAPSEEGRARKRSLRKRAAKALCKGLDGVGNAAVRVVLSTGKAVVIVVTLVVTGTITAVTMLATL